MITSHVDEAPIPALNVADLIAMGKESLEAGRFNEAISHFQAALSLNPISKEPQHYLGLAYLRNGQAKEAISLLFRSTRDLTFSAQSWLHLSYAEEELGRHQRTAVAMRHVVELLPDWGAGRLRYSHALLRISKKNLAMEQASAATRLEPELADAKTLLGILLFHRRKFREAATAFADWAKIEPNQAKAHWYLARALLLAGNRMAAMNMCRRAVQCDPMSVRIRLMIARLAFIGGNPMLGQNHLWKIIKICPDSAIHRASLAQLLLNRLQIDQAAALANKALSLDSQCHSAKIVLARIYIHRNEYSKARSLIDKLFVERPFLPELSKIKHDLNGKDWCIKQNNFTESDNDVLDKPAPSPHLLPLDPQDQPTTAPESLTAFEKPRVGSFAIELEYARSDVQDQADSGINHKDFIDHIFILYALILRDLRLRHLSSSFGFVAEFIRPTLVIIAHCYLFILIKTEMPANIPIESFVIAGFCVWFSFNSACQAGLSGSSWPGGAMTIPGITWFHLCLARVIWALISFVSLCFVYVFVLNFCGYNMFIPNLPLTAMIFIISVSLGFGLGLIAKAISIKFSLALLIEKILIWSLFVTSALYFSISTSQSNISPYLWYNPLLHLIEFERYAFDPGYPIGLVTLQYPSAIAIGLLLTGLMVKKCIRNIS